VAKVENISELTWFDTAVQALSDPQDLRVWSLIVTCFGDIAQTPGDQISGVALTELGAAIGLRSEAVRVALHRLRKDGWIESLREGRASFHRLSTKGLRETHEATPRIYARTPERPQAWHLICSEENTDLPVTGVPPQNYLQLTRRVALGAGKARQAPDEVLSFDVCVENVPAWMQARICPPGLLNTARDLLEALIETDRQLSQSQSVPGALQRAALRTLIVHRWRRLLLKMPELPDGFFPDDWAGESCRNLTAELLERLPCPSLAELETAAGHSRNRR